ncbi:MAG: DUF167 domain-containing protein [Bdellovibrionales bacterium]|nr:DUF167 domain-containing protein [Bdellovibrionales bacterium]
MKISVKVKPNAKKEGVEVQADNIFLVRVNAPPIDGKANARVVELLAKHFRLPKSKIELISGHKGKLKIFKVDKD